MATKDCVLAIVKFCEQNENHIKSQFYPKLSDEQWGLSCDPKNWKRDSKRKEDGKIERVFDCRPFDDQLRAYVTSDLNDQILSVIVQGE